MLKSNYHTHHPLCRHALGEPEEYVLMAISRGYKVLGFSDHGPLSHDLSNIGENTDWLNMTLKEFFTIYLPEINHLRIKYAKDIKILVGVEIEFFIAYRDYFAEIASYLDYMNLSVHFYTHDDKYHNVYFYGDYKTIYSYLKYAKEGMESGLYTIFVHPDIFMMTYHDENGENTFDSHCEYVTREIILTAIKYNVYLEINCSGILRTKERNLPIGEWGYPYNDFWRIAGEYPELKIIIGVDAHEPMRLDSVEIEEALEFAKKHNLRPRDYIEEL